MALPIWLLPRTISPKERIAMSDVPRNAAERERADSELKKALSTLNPDDFGPQLPVFETFIQSIKELFFAEAI
jgi:hypothetical protein